MYSNETDMMRCDGAPQRAHADENAFGGGRPGGGRGSLLDDIFTEHPGAQILFVGSANCLRHGPFRGIATYMRQQKAAVLLPSMTDFASGRYLRQVRDAVAELASERGATEVILIHGCQWVILSTDNALLQQQAEELGVRLIIRDDSHLERGRFGGAFDGGADE
ncbi:MAG: hypothetical protein LUB58_05275 [Oscillospiraceae bacterium]|nr:hypothetical protein [Oscillospiraceae bacterium]MCD8240768.1 hypothetical protein [Oscillospiraceae bacterium]